MGVVKIDINGNITVRNQNIYAYIYTCLIIHICINVLEVGEEIRFRSF